MQHGPVRLAHAPLRQQHTPRVPSVTLAEQVCDQALDVGDELVDAGVPMEGLGLDGPHHPAVKLGLRKGFVVLLHDLHAGGVVQDAEVLQEPHLPRAVGDDLLDARLHFFGARKDHLGLLP
eukprot:8601676-Prorocentrum_lima.AAC.1